MTGWSNAYLGIPFADKGRERTGLDCWGLVRLAYADVLGIVLPSYIDGYQSIEDTDDIAALLTGEAVSPWQPLDAGAEREFDVITLRNGRLLSHVGLVVRPGLMLHVERGGTSTLASYRDGRMRRRVVAIHRHAGAAHAH